MSDSFSEQAWGTPERKFNGSALSEVREFPRPTATRSDIIFDACYKLNVSESGIERLPVERNLPPQKRKALAYGRNVGASAPSFILCK